MFQYSYTWMQVNRSAAGGELSILFGFWCRASSQSLPILFSCLFLTQSRQLLGFMKKWNVSCSVVSDSLPPHGLWPSILHPWDSPGKNTGVGCLSLLQGIFLIQRINLFFSFFFFFKLAEPPGTLSNFFCIIMIYFNYPFLCLNRI